MSFQDVARPLLAPRDRERLAESVRAGNDDGVREIIMRAITNLAKRPGDDGQVRALTSAWHTWTARKRNASRKGRHGVRGGLRDLPDDVFALVTQGVRNRNRAALAGVSRGLRRASRVVKDVRVAELERIVKVLKALRLTPGPGLVARIYAQVRGLSAPGVETGVRGDVGDSPEVSWHHLYVQTDHFHAHFFFIARGDKLTHVAGTLFQMTRRKGKRFLDLVERDELATKQLLQASARLQEAETRRAEAARMLREASRFPGIGLSQHGVDVNNRNIIAWDPALVAAVRKAWAR